MMKTSVKEVSQDEVLRARARRAFEKNWESVRHPIKPQNKNGGCSPFAFLLSLRRKNS